MPTLTRPATFPAFSLFLVGLTYAGLAIIIASDVAGGWSAGASLITFYLVLVAPVLLGVMAYNTWRKRHDSRAHQVVFYASTGYFLLLPLLIGLAFLFR